MRPSGLPRLQLDSPVQMYCFFNAHYYFRSGRNIPTVCFLARVVSVKEFDIGHGECSKSVQVVPLLH